MAVLLISSDLPEVLGMSDRIAVMRGGTIAAVLPGKSPADEVMAAALGSAGILAAGSGTAAGTGGDAGAGEESSIALPTPAGTRSARGKPYIPETSGAMARGFFLLLLPTAAPGLFSG